MKKILTTALSAILLTSCLGTTLYAAPVVTVDDGSTDIASASMKKAIDTAVARTRTDLQPTAKEMSAVTKIKPAAKGFSTGKKIAIGVGIAAAALGIFVFAASRDKIRTF